MARQNQHRREVALLSEAKDRERRLIECRKTAEERKNYFESMERHMFATRSSVKVSTYIHNPSLLNLQREKGSIGSRGKRHP